MMSDALNVALRLALYIDLLLLFGIAAFGLCSLRECEPPAATLSRLRSLLAGTAFVGLALALANMWLLAMLMSGETAPAALWAHIAMMLTDTDMGQAWAVRIAAITLAGLAMVFSRQRPTACLGIVMLGGAVAVATLAWNGHGAMDEGERRFWHFTADILHLWAAGGWLGALVVFGLLLRPSRLTNLQQVELLSRSLTGFGLTGSAIVITLSVTGIVNYLFIVGPTLDAIAYSLYGQLLLAKLALFACMIGFASLNRFRLGPRLESALLAGDHPQATQAIRRSVTLELGAALLIIAIVAWLGTLSPEMEMALP